MALGASQNGQRRAVRLRHISTLLKFIAVALAAWSLVDFFVRFGGTPTPRVEYLVTGGIGAAILWIAAWIMDGYSKR